jgi:hypothetical protein
LYFTNPSSHFFRLSIHFLKILTHVPRKFLFTIATPSHSGTFATHTCQPASQRLQKSLPARPTLFTLKVLNSKASPQHIEGFKRLLYLNKKGLGANIIYKILGVKWVL